jgi:hypothetical protein
LDEESASRTIGADGATDECDFERELTLPILLINKKSSEKSRSPKIDASKSWKAKIQVERKKGHPAKLDVHDLY